MIAATTRNGCNAKRFTMSRRSVGMVVMLTNSPNISAPMRIRKSMAVVRAPSTRERYRVRQVSERRHRANAIETNAPTPAPSVAVNSPTKIPPMEKTNSDVIAPMPRRAFARRPRCRIAPDDVAHGDAQQVGREQAREHPGGEKQGDVGLRDDPVDHHHGRGRYEDPERSAGGNRACRKVIGVAEFLQRRIGDL